MMPDNHASLESALADEEGVWYLAPLIAYRRMSFTPMLAEFAPACDCQIFSPRALNHGGSADCRCNIDAWVESCTPTL